MTKRVRLSGRRGFLQSLAAALPLNSCMRLVRGENLPHLFACERDDLVAFAKRTLHLSIDPRGVSRNSSGSILYVATRERPGKPHGEVLVVSANGPPTAHTVPADIWAISDGGTFVAWSDDIKEGLRFSSGFHQEVPRFAPFGFSPGSQYYFVADNDNRTVIYETTRPGTTLAEARFVGREIFCKNDRIFIFGLEYEAPEIREIIGVVFRRISGVWRHEADIRIPRPHAAASPFVVEDLDPWSDRVLCLDVRDELGAEWFLYDLKARTMTDIGSSHGFGLFLDQKVIARVGGQGVQGGRSRKTA